jgi:hypothetical protein
MTPTETWEWIIGFLSPLLAGVGFIIAAIVIFYAAYIIFVLIWTIVYATIKYKNPLKFIKIFKEGFE